MMRASRGAPDPARAELDAEILDWMREAEWREDEGRFERLALALFAFQFEHCAAYRSFCEGRGRAPGRVLAVPAPCVPVAIRGRAGHSCDQ